MLDRILTSKKDNPESKIIYSTNDYITDKKTRQDSAYNWDDWASRSGIYRKLPENHKEYLDKVINKLEKALLDNW
jgi:hypothetical protein